MIAKLKIFICGLLIGCLVGLISMYKIQSVEMEIADVQVEQISGEKIVHKDFKLTKKNIEFNTVANGKGEIKTTIPKTNIPEAKKWITKDNMIIGSFTYYDSEKIYGVNYYRRFDVFNIGGGVLGSGKNFGVNIGVGYIW